MFKGPVVGVVHDAARLVGGDGVAFHEPFDGGFAVDDVFVGLKGNACDGELFVIDDAALVVDSL